MIEMAKLHFVFSLTLLVVCLISPSKGQTDETLIDKAYGFDVVQAVNTKLRLSRIFMDDNRFLMRMAYVETKYGMDTGTYATPDSGGIWQIKPDVFNTTQLETYALLRAKARVLAQFDINWEKVTLEDLHKPFYSGLAVKLLLTNLNETVPDTISKQADFWKQYFNPNGSTIGFINDIKELEKESPCTGRMKMVLVMDGSQSVGSDNFRIAKNFTADLAATFDWESVPMGFIVYSTSLQVIFNLTSNLNDTARREAILGAVYPSGTTATHLAIYSAIDLLTAVVDDNSNSVPRIMVVFTDGRSNNRNLTIMAAENATRNEITTFACGIGDPNQLDADELLLIAQNNPNQVISSSSYEALIEFPYRINEETCSIPQTPPTNGSVTDNLNKNETRYIAYTISFNGITLNINVTVGRTEGFFSYSFPLPSSAMNDGIIKDGKLFIPYEQSRTKQGDANSTQIFVAVRGFEDKNEFSIQSVEGDNSSGFTLKAVSVTTLIALILSVLYSRVSC